MTRHSANRVAISSGTQQYKLVLGSNGLGLAAPQLITDASGTLQAGFVYGDLGPTLRYDAQGNATYYLEDAMGSVAMLTGSTGTPTASFRYDGYGNLLSQSGQATSTLPGDFRF